ncbi:MAG: hypothetical protein MUE73_13325 [Planctomycetes bacterium]|jgi:hypothetical protein|nr:hypothetical protein [Planctomycetota bacterium]
MWIIAAIVTVLLLAGASPPGRRLRTGASTLLMRVPRRTFLLSLVLTTGGLRLALLAAFTPPDTVDMREYVEKAKAIAADGHPREQESRPDGTRVYRALGYPLALAGWYAATGWTGTSSARCFNTVLAMLTAWLLVVTGERLRCPAEGRIAALLMAIHLPHAIFSVIPYGETWATLLLLGTLAALHTTSDALSRARPGAGPAAIAGALLGLLLITRPEYLWLPAAIAMTGFLRHRGSGLKLLTPVSAGLLALAIPFLVNHAMRVGYPGVLRISVQGGLILYFGNNPLEVNGHGNGTPATRERLAELSRGDPLRRRATAEALGWMKANPLSVLANVPKKLHHLWLAKPEGFDWHVRAGQSGGLPLGLNRFLGAVGWLQWLLLFAAGLLGLFRFRDRFAPLILLILAQSALFGLLSAVPRFHLPFEPVLALGTGLLVRPVSTTSTRGRRRDR